MTAPEIAARAHEGQFRRDGVTPYIEHPKMVASFFPEGSVEWEVAWLHDTIEGTPLELFDLEQESNLQTGTVINVWWLTHRKGETYDEYIQRVAKGPIARRVKIADIFANLSDSPSPRQKEKYKKALTHLLSAI